MRGTWVPCVWPYVRSSLVKKASLSEDLIDWTIHLLILEDLVNMVRGDHRQAVHDRIQNINVEEK